MSWCSRKPLHAASLPVNVLCLLLALSKCTAALARETSRRARPQSTRPSVADQHAAIYSSYNCVGSKHDIAEPNTRLCMFQNICASGHAPDISFTFYKETRHPVFFDEVEGYMYDFPTSAADSFVYLTPRYLPYPGLDNPVHFVPRVSYEPLPSTASGSEAVYLLWEKRIGDDNIGHLIWEDFFSMWLAIRTFGMHGQPVQVLNVGPPCQGLCAKTAEFFVSRILGLPVKMYNSHASELTQQGLPVCFKSLSVGGYVRFYEIDTIRQRGFDPLLSEYRALALIRSGLDPGSIPRENHIVLTKKQDSNRGSLRNIVNLEEIEGFLLHTYPEIRVSVVEWNGMPWVQQFEILLSTTVIITPPGGCSALLPFLPNGAHAIIMDYHRTEDNRSVALEGGFWNHWSHIKNDYYIVNRPEQYIQDEDCGDCLSKDSMRTIVDVKQLQVLIDGALADLSIKGVGTSASSTAPWQERARRHGVVAK